MSGQTVKIRSSEGGEFDCYLVVPKAEAAMPAIVLASAVHGVDADIREIADELMQAVARNGKIAAVAGKAVALTGAGEYFQRLIELGYVHRFFTGNAFAVYDVERALFGTSGGVSLGRPLPGAGHENHLRAVNLLRALGGIALLTTGAGFGALLMLGLNAAVRWLGDYARLHYRLLKPEQHAG